MYLTLIPEKIIKTSTKIFSRIQQHFPDSGLSKVSKELQLVAKVTKEKCQWIAKSNLILRSVIGILFAGIFGAIFIIWHRLEVDFKAINITQFVEFTEALLNILLIFGAAILFLITVETRLKRHRALKGLHELRALAHVIDMSVYQTRGILTS